MHLNADSVATFHLTSIDQAEMPRVKDNSTRKLEVFVRITIVCGMAFDLVPRCHQGLNCF